MLQKQSPTQAQIRAWLSEYLVETHGIDPSEIDWHLSFESIGLSSREVVMLSGDMEEWLGRQLSPTFLWEHNSIEDLADFLVKPQIDEPPSLDSMDG